MGIFEPFQFKIVLMSDDQTFVDYNFDQRSRSEFYIVSPK